MSASRSVNTVGVFGTAVLVGSVLLVQRVGYVALVDATQPLLGRFHAPPIGMLLLAATTYALTVSVCPFVAWRSEIRRFVESRPKDGATFAVLGAILGGLIVAMYIVGLAGEHVLVVRGAAMRK